MRRFILAAALALATPAFAASDVAVGTMLGTDTNAVKQALVDMGYDLRRFENEGGMIEAYVVKGDTKAILIIDLGSGKVVRIGENE